MQFTFTYPEEILKEGHPAGIEVYYDVTAEAVHLYDNDPCDHTRDVYTGFKIDILKIEYNGRELPVFMPREPKMSEWLDKVKEAALNKYDDLCADQYIKITIHDSIPA